MTFVDQNFLNKLLSWKNITQHELKEKILKDNKIEIANKNR